jgi:hypothetical protein
LLVRGAILPHAPLLIGPHRGNALRAATRTREAVAALRLTDGAPCIAVLSSHGRVTSVYEAGHGSLRDFGIDSADLDVAVDRGLTEELASAWHEPLDGSGLDHGIVVPLTLLEGVRTVVAATVAEDLPVRTAIEQGRSFARALAACSAPIAFVASAHTGAALSPRAPLGLREQATDVEQRLLDHLSEGTGHGDSILEDLALVGGSCGAAPLAAFIELFAGRATVHSYGAPYGVGYLVATAEP